MTEIHIPLSIIYETYIPTPIADVITALKAADAISPEAILLLPSLIDGLQIEEYSLNVHSRTDGSLKEALFLALLITYPSDVAEEVPPLLEDLFKLPVSDKYDTIVVIPPFLMGLSRRIRAAVFSFIAGVMSPMPMLGRALL